MQNKIIIKIVVDVLLAVVPSPSCAEFALKPQRCYRQGSSGGRVTCWRCWARLRDANVDLVVCLFICVGSGNVGQKYAIVVRACGLPDGTVDKRRVVLTINKFLDTSAFDVTKKS